jgi:hypothetical protein
LESVAPVFIRSLALVWRSIAAFGVDLTPSVSFLFTNRKLACLFYRLIKHGQQYVDKGMEYYEAKYREQQIRSLMKRAQKLGFQLVAPKTA